MTNRNLPIVVLGDGWSALLACASLTRSQKQVLWVTGTGARLVAPLSTLEPGPGAEYWRQLAESFAISSGEFREGSFLREFHAKAFRAPEWVSSQDEEEKKGLYEAAVVHGDRSIVSRTEGRFEMTPAEIEDALRAEILDSEKFSNLKRIEGVPVIGFTISSGRVTQVQLGNGQFLECESVIFADRWASISKVSGLPKPLLFLKGRDPQGVLQITFRHEMPVGLGVTECFSGALRLESGEKRERKFWGHFSSDGKISYWSICFSAEQGEDNHEIAKKLRQMKTVLDRMFVGDAWIPAGKKSFMSNVIDEQVRFEEAMLFGGGHKPSAPQRIESIENLDFITDGYGPSQAAAQVAAMGLLPEIIENFQILEKSEVQTITVSK